MECNVHWMQFGFTPGLVTVYMRVSDPKKKVPYQKTNSRTPM